MNDTHTSSRGAQLRVTWVPVRDARGRVHLESRWQLGTVETAAGLAIPARTGRDAHAA